MKLKKGREKRRQLTFNTFDSKQLLPTTMSGGRRYDTNSEGLVSITMSGGREYSMRGRQDEWQKSIDPFLRDIIAIQGSDPFGRLFGKMQVFSTPLNNLVSNRGTHTGKVVAIAIQIAYMLGLNIYLCIAIALGHDVGHCPYGPNGCRILGIKHPLNGVIILQEVAELNLTREVVIGILYHSLDKNNLDNGERLSNEAFTVAVADKIAYLPPDIIDFDRMGMLKDLVL
ncbi:HD domain-containing protein, partial [Candidatus Parcubacteria bacterium]|nr:HD domain-containing protein [Candidatus Parcubacteria bacterium]